MKKNYCFLRKMLLLVIIGMSSTWMYGIGSTQISDAAGLAAISNDLAGSYELTSDITLSGNWSPIGTFTGTLDGAGHIIYGLTVDESGTAERGLFSKTNGATIRNLGLENANIVGNERIGGIVGLMEGGLIEECYVGNSYIEGRDHVGALAGQIKSQAIVQNCYATADIYSRQHQAGGLVGVINHTGTKILNCYFSGIVRCADQKCPAGIVAWCDNDRPTVGACVNLARYVLGNSNLRMVGNDGVEMIDLYSISTCKLSTDINNYNGNTVPTDDGNYGTTKRHGANLPSDDDALSSTFYVDSLGWDFTETTGVWKMLGDGYPVLQWQTAPVDAAVFRLASSYSMQNGDAIDLNDLVSNRGLEIIFSTTSSKIDIVDNVATAHDINTPEVVVIKIGVDGDYNEVDSIKVNLFPTGAITISTPEELNAVTNFSNMDFELTADLDMTGLAFSGLCSNDVPYTGTFDGKGHIIKGLTYDNTSTSSMGLFTKTSGATIKNVGIEGASIIANKQAGVLIGVMSGGLVEQCYVANSYVEGTDHVASIAGQINSGAVIQNCYSSADVYSRSSQAGGIGGVILDANSRVSKCYFSGKVAIPTNRDRPGGIVGLVDADGITIEYCVNLASSIIGGGNVRIIQTGSKACTLTSNYSLSTTMMGTDGSIASTSDSNVAEDKLHGANLPSDADALSSDFYVNTLAWDFTETTGAWKMLNAGYPVLQWQTAPQAISVFSKPNTALISTGSVDLNKLFVANNADNAVTFTTANANVTIDANNMLTMNSAVSALETAIITITPKADFNFTPNVATSLSVTLVPDAMDPVEISTAAQLAIVDAYPAKNYKLMADIDMTDVEFDGLCSNDAPFTGIFDGNAYVISNVTNTKWADQGARIDGTGLFNVTKGATIKKLGLESALVTGIAANVGGIIGRMQGGLLEECYVSTSEINGQDHVGALVGGMNDFNNDKSGAGATVQNCYSDTYVHSIEHQAGGLVGTLMKGLVEKCYFSGMVKNDKYRAVGLVGYQDNSSTSDANDVIVRNNINLAVSILSQDRYSSETFRVFDNNNRTCTMANNYSISTTLLGKADLSASGVASVELTTDGRNGANLPNDTDAKTAVFYTGTLAWDLTDVWTIDEGNSYPVLKAFQAEEIPTKVDAPSSLMNVVAYPNPVMQGQYFNLMNETSGSVKIFSLQGNLMSQARISANENISTDNLIQGTYILQFTTGTLIKNAKLIVR